MNLLLLCLSAVTVAVTAQGGYKPEEQQQQQQIIIRGARYTVQAGSQNQLQTNNQVILHKMLSY